MNIETICQYLSLLLKQYANDLQSLKKRYKCLDPNYMDSNCANFTDKNVSERTEEKQNGNEDSERNNYERNSSKNNNSEINASKNDKSADKNESKQNNENKRKKHVRPIKRA